MRYFVATAAVLLTVLPLLFSGSVYASLDTKFAQELYQRIESLGREINQLRGNNEKITHELEQLKANQKKGFLAIDDRIDKLSQQKSKLAPPAPPTKPVPTKPKVAPKPRPTPKQQSKPVPKKPIPVRRPTAASKRVDIKKAYNHAYDALKLNRREGIKQFNLFLKKYPTSSLAENANYWIGEAKYALRDYRGAANAFVIVLNKYKSGRKAPDAAVKLGYSFYELKDWTLARRTFQDVLRYFPKSNAAKLAQQRIQRMQKEGH